MQRLPLYGLTLLAAAYGLAPIVDGDLFWNLNVGHWILDTGGLLPEIDPFVANARPGGVQHEWLIQVAFAAVDRALGLNGLRLLGAVVSATAVWLCHATFARQTKWPGLSVAATAVWWILVEPHAVLRPHMIGWIFALWVLGLEFAAPSRSSKAQLGRLFLVCVVWANAHASVLIAPFYAAVALAAALVSPAGRGSRKQLAIVWIERGVAAFVACLLTPAGWHLIPYALHTPAVNKELSYEWWPLLRLDVWHSRPAVLVAWGALAVAVAVVGVWADLAWRKGSSSTSDKPTVVAEKAELPRFPRFPQFPQFPQFPGFWAAAIALAHAALTRRMTAFLFLPLNYVVRYVDSVTARAPSPESATSPRGHRITVTAAWCSLVLAVFLHGRVAKANLTAEPLVAGAFPNEATAFAREAGLQGTLFNPDGWGGYIAYRLKNQKVYADGRWPLVGKQVIADGIEVMLRRRDITPLLDQYQIDWAVFRAAEYFRVPGPDPRRWMLAWRDDTSVVLLRKTPEFAANLARVCRFYERFDVKKRANWAFEVTSRSKVRSPTGVPSALALCPKTAP